MFTRAPGRGESVVQGDFAVADSPEAGEANGTDGVRLRFSGGIVQFGQFVGGEPRLTGGQGWVLSNHDFSRLVTRAGPDNARAVELLLLSLPGPVFLFQGDELGFADAPMSGPEQDRNHRDPFRTPMVWDSTAPFGGFSSARPWLIPAQPPAAGAVQQSQDSDSTLTLTRRAMALRSRLTSNETQILQSEPGTIALRRGEHIVAVNLADDPTISHIGMDKSTKVQTEILREIAAVK